MDLILGKVPKEIELSVKNSLVIYSYLYDINLYLIEQPYTHEKIVQEYNEKFVLPDLKQRQIYLEELREYYRPIERSELVSHQHSYENFKRIREKEKKTQRNNSFQRKIFANIPQF